MDKLTKPEKTLGKNPAWVRFDLLAGGALFVVLEVPSIKAKLEEQVGYDQKNAFEPEDLSELKALLARAEAPKRLRLAGPDHNTFNPVGWFEANGNLVKDKFYGKKGPNAVVIKSTSPLYLRIHDDRKGMNPQDPRYSFYVTREAADKKTERRKVTRVSRLRDKNDILFLEVKGSPTNPESFVLTLLNSNQNIEVLSSQEFKEIRGYKADLEYEAGNRKYSGVMKGDKVTIDKRSYEIVFISEDEVVLSDEKTSTHTNVSKNAL